MSRQQAFFFYGNHFRSHDLIQQSMLFDYGTGGGTTPFAMGLVQAILVGGGSSVLGWLILKGAISLALWVHPFGSCDINFFDHTSI